MSKKVVFTIAARNYLALATTLMESAAKNFQNEVKLVVVIADVRSLNEMNVVGKLPSYQRLQEICSIYALDDLADDDVYEMFARYDPTEFCTSIKPLVLNKLREDGFSQVVYLDPDIEIFDQCTHLFEALDSSSIVVTPHVMSPYSDKYGPTILNIQQAGVFNFGFVAFNFSFEEAVRVNNWWMRTLKENCYVNVENGVFVDQKWGNLFPCFAQNLHVLHHPGYNVAYWNLHERAVLIDAGTYTSNGQPLQFFHFSGFSPKDRTQLSKHQDRFILSEMPTIYALTKRYAEKLLDNNFIEYQKISYGEDFFASSKESDDSGSVPERGRVAVHEGKSSSGFVFTILKKHGHAVNVLVKTLMKGEFKEFSKGISYKGRKALSLYGRYAGQYLLSISGRIEPKGEKTRERSQRGAKKLEEGPTTEAEPPEDGGVNVVGYLNSELGVGESARGVVAALDNLGIKVHLYNWNESPSRKNESVYENRFSRKHNLGALEIVHVNADQVDSYLRSSLSLLSKAKKRVGYWYWELSDFPSKWSQFQLYFEEIWVATNFVKESVQKKVRVPVRVVPPLISFQKTEQNHKMFDLDSRDINVLINFDGFSFQERKNPLGAIEAFRIFIENNPSIKAKLVIKSINLSESQKAELSNLVGNLPVKLIFGYLDSEDLRTLVSTVDIYMSLHRSEGLGLNIIEAMQFGKPVIVTAYGGNMDFCNEKNSLLVDYDLVRINTDCGPYEKGMWWAEPRILNAASCLQSLAKDSELRETIGRRAAIDTKELFSPQRISERFAEAIKGVDISL